MLNRNNVLITATIKPNTDVMVAVSDDKERLDTYVEMLRYWILETSVDEIVFCENSNYEWSFTELIELAKCNDKKLEVLTFLSSGGAVEKGKGFAEGEIFSYAIENSVLIKKWTSFYKASGRIKVLNINKVFEKSQDFDCMGVLAAPRSQTMDTRFFKLSLEYFKENLIDAYREVNDSAGHYLEHAYFNKIKVVGGVAPFKVYPNIVGISGSTGDSYNKSKLGLMMRQLALWGGFYSLPFKV